LKTMDNLRDAFAGESQANRRYLAFAKKAEQDGYPQAARLFRAAAEAETVHAHNHLRIMGGIKSTQETLQEAIGGETFGLHQNGGRRGEQGGGVELQRRQHGRGDPRGTVQEGGRHLEGWEGRAEGRLLRLQGLRQHRGGVTSGQVPDMRCAEDRLQPHPVASL